MNVPRLRECREQRLMTQTELATKAGLTTATVSRLETGRTPRASFSTVRKLAAALSVEPQALMNGRQR
jgi:transcriptional regulator with XRE-family HTH domain